jgi:hypothetical protein
MVLGFEQMGPSRAPYSGDVALVLGCRIVLGCGPLRRALGSGYGKDRGSDNPAGIAPVAAAVAPQGPGPDAWPSASGEACRRAGGRFRLLTAAGLFWWKDEAYVRCCLPEAGDVAQRSDPGSGVRKRLPIPAAFSQRSRLPPVEWRAGRSSHRLRCGSWIKQVARPDAAGRAGWDWTGD